MGKALAGADLAIVADVYAAREQKVEGVSGETVAVAVGYMGGRAIFVPKRDDLDEMVAEQVRSGDVVALGRRSPAPHVSDRHRHGLAAHPSTSCSRAA